MIRAVALCTVIAAGMAVPLQGAQAQAPQTPNTPAGRAAAVPVVPPSPLPTPLRAPSLAIVSATYGPGSSSSVCTAMTFVRAQCAGRSRCSLPVSAASCDLNSPVPTGLFTRLTVTYRCFDGDVVRSRSAEHPFTLRISCAGAH